MGNYLSVLSTASLLSEPPQTTSVAVDGLENAHLHSGINSDHPVRILSERSLKRPQGMDRWPRIDRYGRALSVACSLAHPASTAPDQSLSGLYVCSQHSCTETNYAFSESQLVKGPSKASPFLFPYTLPGSTACEAAMFLSLGGPYLINIGGPAAALGTVVTALDSIEGGLSDRILVATSDVLGGATLRYFGENAPDPGKPTPTLSEAAGAIWLGHPDDPLPGPRAQFRPLLSRPLTTAEALESTLEPWLRSQERDLGTIQQIISSSSDPMIMAEEHRAFSNFLPNPAITHLAWKLGDCGASLGLLGMLSGLEESGVTLVMATDRGASVAILVSAP